MTDQERKMLKCYLTECLEPRLKRAQELAIKYGKDAITATTRLDADFAVKLHRHHNGQADAYQHAIDDFHELFEEDLKEGE